MRPPPRRTFAAWRADPPRLTRPSWPIRDLAAYLRGRWDVVTLGWDAGGRPMRVRARALVSGADQALRLLEHGESRIGPYRGPASRSTLLRCHGPAAALFFADGRPFHTLDLAAGVAQVAHQCPPDTYAGRYRLAGPDLWWRAWHVEGPRKQQRIVSRFRRILDDTDPRGSGGPSSPPSNPLS